MSEITGKITIVLLACGLGVFVGQVTSDAHLRVTMSSPELSQSESFKSGARLDKDQRTLLHPVRTAQYAPYRYELLNGQMTDLNLVDGGLRDTKRILLVDRLTGDVWEYSSITGFTKVRVARPPP